MARTTTFKFYRGVNLNLRSNDTFYFASRSAQNTFFASKLVYTESNCYYQRSNSGTVKVKGSYSTLYNCDYLSFINSSYENHIFYGYITGVTYIDDSTTEVSYVIDVIQTWLLDCTAPSCFIERYHSVSDNIGDNLLDDGLDCGMYQSYSMSDNIVQSDMLVVFLSTFDLYTWATSSFATKQAAPIQVKNGVYDELCMTAVYCQVGATGSADTGSALSLLLSNIYNGTGGVTYDDIVNIYIYPKIGLNIGAAAVIGTQSGSSALLNNIYRVQGAWYSTVGTGTVPGQEVNLPAVPSTVAGITPKNKKLLQYPYTLIHISNNDGSAIDLRYERFTDPAHPKAQVVGCTTGEGKIRLTPKSYLGVTGNNMDFDTSIDSGPYPTVSMVGDAYLIYLAQNKNRINNGYNQMMINAALPIAGAAANDIKSVTSTYAGGQMGAFSSGASEGMSQSKMFGGMQLTKTGLSTAFNVFNQIQSLNAQFKDMAVAPATASGISGCGLSFQNGKPDFTVSVKQIDRMHAESIDAYFTMFGYPLRKFAAPLSQINNRPQFSYVKTVGCIMKGSVPEDAKATIEQLFDAGIRFWSTPANIGDYTVNNAPTPTP